MSTTAGLIQLENISRKYYLDKTEICALDNVSLQINKGDFVVLAGPSGSGKTTLLNIIGCIDKPSHGNNIGFIFQTFNLIPVLTAFENIELPLLFKGLDEKQIKLLAVKFLQRVGIGEKINQKPSNLSGGQRQRLAIARALAGNPSLIVADEPTASLDRKNAESIIELLRELNDEFGVTVVLASHDPMIIEHSRTKLFMRDGCIVSD